MPSVSSRPTALGLGVLAADAATVVVALLTGTPELAPLAVVLAVPLVCAPFIARSRARRMRSSASFHAHVEPAEAPVGGAVRWMLSVTDRSRDGRSLPAAAIPPPGLAWRSVGADRLTTGHGRWTAPATGRLVPLPVPAPGGTATAALSVPTARRGIFELPSGQSWVHDPFGLWGAPGPTTPTAAVVVHPTAIAPWWEPGWTANSEDGATPVGSSPRAGSADLEGIRPYVVGDRLSLLHWPSRARYGSWYVREFGTESAHGTTLVVDDRAGVHRSAAFEQLVATTLWTIDDMLDRGMPVQLVTLSGANHTFDPSPNGRAHARRVAAGIGPVRGAPTGPATRLPTGAVVLTTSTGARRLPGAITADRNGADPGTSDEFADRGHLVMPVVTR